MKAFVYPVLISLGLILVAQALTPTDSLGSVTSDGVLSLSTGGGHRAISSLGNWLGASMHRLMGWV